MIVLTSWVFRLIMNELNDNRTLWNYVRTYSWAEWAQELSLLDLKETWYWTTKNLETSDLLNPWKNTARDIKISFKNDWKVTEYEWEIWAWEYHMMPLFIIDLNDNSNWSEEQENKTTEKKVEDIDLTVIQWDKSNLVWNIIWEDSWISNSWEIKWTDTVNEKIHWKSKRAERLKDKLTEEEKEWFVIKPIKINSFLSESEKNYLQLYNASKEPIKYKVTSSWEFTKPMLTITSNWESATHRTNIDTKINLSDITSKSKYSIFSPDVGNWDDNKDSSKNNLNNWAEENTNWNLENTTVN